MIDKGLKERCRRTLRILVGLQRWKLIAADDEAFIDEAGERIAARPPEKWTDETIRQVMLNCYCIRLYHAFGLNGTEQQRLAMDDVKDFVFRRLLVMAVGDEQLADTCAQTAVEQAWLKLQTVQEPGSFLGFVLRIGIHELFDYHRREGRLLDVPEDEAGHTEVGDSKPLSAESAEQAVAVTDLRERLRAAIKNCLERMEEARLLIEIFLEGKTYHELAESWGREARYLQVLKFRALKNLRGCSDFWALKQDWAFT